MIPTRQVTTALLAHLRGHLDAPVGDHTAPTPPPAIYHVLELAAGSTLGVTLGDPAAWRHVRYRIRTVATANNIAASRQAVEAHADEAMAVVLSRRARIYGDGWEIGHRGLIADSGVISDSGPTANLTRDYQLHIAHGPVAPPAS